ncbi:ABC transporter substrate-binding protein [Lacrimispora sp. NSJ-141]|uniref:ABC transporter substrate-binding protein n=1 Tax=Lientehia hominis TaxID=2897778 RepID=A0AAP2RHS1_9FIRM|nr:ABC transporter substrate-binding protein [Lientehia hominis]MCD2492006.1 ABC transporter substrate-binding protein [Lientehia hominis]
MKRIIAVLLAVVMVFSLTACSGGKAETKNRSEEKTEETETPSKETKKADGASEEPIYVGVLAPLTGTMAEYGKTYEVAMTMAMEEINAAGGINGRELVLDFADSKGEQNESADLAASFAENDKYAAVLGDFSSGCAMAAAPICDEAGIVLFSPTASNVDFAPMSDYCFQIAGRTDGEGIYAAEYIVGKYVGAKNIAIFSMNTDWGVSTRDYFAEASKDAGLNVVFDEAYAEGESDFSSLITKAEASEPDCVVIIDQSSTSNLINQIRGYGWDCQIVMVGPSTSQQIIELCADNSEGVLTTASVFYSEEDPQAWAFAQEFAERAKFQPTVMAGYAYDSIYVLADAIARLGDDITRDGIRGSLAKTDDTYLTGPIKFSEVGDISRSYLICEVSEGEYVVRCGYDYAEE